MLNGSNYRQCMQDDGNKRETDLLLFEMIICAAITPAKTQQISTEMTVIVTEKQQSNIQVKIKSQFYSKSNLRPWLIFHSFLVHNSSLPVNQHSSFTVNIQCLGSRIQLGLLQLPPTVSCTATAGDTVVDAMAISLSIQRYTNSFPGL